ncbi:response regulator transcription factor [Anaerotignum propionicum]|uniref:response regulator transcription factor n=1 Tax=Anaerotignum propionicum TaxID=28446 RepID=UPI0028A290FA|nr:response regulator transcription factor [Anaerotignum propionicum]MEA5057049.1 response regulator transcription factor [Anaerotignum propionicum]
MIKILIVDDMIILRECLKLVIGQNTELEVVGCAGDGREAIDLCLKLKPDVILMDLNMPVFSGHDAIMEIKKLEPSTKILVLSVEDDEKNIATAFKNGADGYVSKDIVPEELFAVIKKAFAGERYIQEFAFYIKREWIASTICIGTEQKFSVELTERQKEVLDLVVQGMTNEEIGDTIGMSAGRARNIVAELISKFMVKNRTQLAVMAATTQMSPERK